MTTFDPVQADWQTGILAGWTYEKPVNKWFQGQFRAAHRLVRTCPTCSDPMILDVTTKALEGKATNHGLSLRRCKRCREALKHAPQEYAQRKALGENAPPEPPAVTGELETLRMANSVMKEELEGLYARNTGLFAENQVLKARLSTYELQGAMEAIGCEPVQNTTNGALPPKLPWE